MPFCKMCYDLGRSDFDNHNVRDSARNTTCPYILNTKCRNCGCYGHTLSYCNMSRHINSLPQKSVVKHIDIVKSATKPNNPFDLLHCQDANDEDEAFNELDVYENNLPSIKNIQWGKGFILTSWADEVENDNNKTWAQIIVS